MNIIGKTFKVLNWVLFGKGRTLIDVAKHIGQNTEVEVTKDGAIIRFKKEF